MKRLLVFAAVVVLSLVASGPLLAQSNSEVGTWKLDVAKSQFINEEPPKSETLTVEAQGDGAKISVDGVAADGNHVAYSYMTNYDGEASPISWVGVPNEQDTIAVKRIDANTTVTTVERAFNVVQTFRAVVSKDGMVMTITANGINEIVEPINATTVWEKQ